MSAGLLAALISAVAFSTSGAFIKPLLEAGWSPVTAVTARALTAGLVLLPFVLLSLRGRWAALWRARRRVLGMGLVGVAFTQVAYFAAIQRIPVATALLIEYLAPLLLVAYAWAVTRRVPRPAVLLGSVLAVGGLVLVIGPGAVRAVDPLGLVIAFCAAVGCAAYFVIAARPADGLPPVALAGAGLLLAGGVLALAGATGLLPVSAAFGDLSLFGRAVPWWLPLLIVAVVGTAAAYATGIAASAVLGSRLASFLGLLEVVSAALLAWLLLDERLTPLQFVGGGLILGGIAAVRTASTAPLDAPDDARPAALAPGRA
ncbi:membrane protein [Amorphoplanes nipponensis]|uniref:Membrane protein n=2 Tax=Actinoplanes nipponensis TaxID=135950 RepID=A0A919MSE9_9ACTN|nr:membrane protein [Actinoplanes nipponensis]